MLLFGLRVFSVVVQIIWICLTIGINGEMRFVCPRPQIPNSRILEGPCGTGPEEPFEGNFMEVSPGPLTVQLEETVAHKGSPIRIALMAWDSNLPPCVLLDHIPHNDQASARETPDCRINGYPISHCYGAATFLTVEIPDIDCPKCVLQMINVATDEYSADQEPCYQWEPGKNNCTTFYSCANIRVIPTASGRGKNLGACINHQVTLLNRWPYTPVEKYNVLLGEPFEETNYLNLYEYRDWSVYYEYSLSNANLTVRRGSVALFEGLKPVRFFGSTEGRLKILTVDERRKLKAGEYIIRITGRLRNGTYRNFNIPVNGSIGLYGDKLYRDHSAVYSAGGMLAEKRFRGPGATYPQVNFPAGGCQAQGIESYGSVLSPYKSLLPRALVSFIVNRDLLYAHIASSYELDRVVFTTRWNNTKDEAQRQNMVFNRGGAKGVFYEGADFVGDYLTKTGGRRPTHVSMVVQKEGKLDVLYGDILRGIQGVMRNGLSNLGLVFVTFPDDNQAFNLHIMISNSTSILAEGYELSLITPFKSFSINPIARMLPLDSYMVFYNVTVPIVDLEIAQFFWTGQLAVTIRDVHTQKIHRAQLNPLSEEVCKASQNIACKSKILLSEDGGPVDRGRAAVSANGLATIGVSAEQGLLDISIWVRDVQESETVTSVRILRNVIDSLTLPAASFSRYKNRLYGTVQISVGRSFLRDMEKGSLMIEVTLKRPYVRAARIRGRIPRDAAYTPSLTIAQRTTRLSEDGAIHHYHV